MFKIFEPNRDFVAKTKSTFLHAYRVKFGVPQRQPIFGFQIFVRGAAATFALILILSGTSTYAYTKDVAPDNVLYPLKRAQETIRGYFKSEVEKPIFHVELAEKRLKEATELKTKNPESQKVVKLAEDVRKEMKKSLKTLETAELTVSTPSEPTLFKTTEIEMGKEKPEKPKLRTVPLPAAPRDAASFKEFPNATTSEKDVKFPSSATEKFEELTEEENGDERERFEISQPEQSKIAPRKNGRYVCKALNNLIKSEMSEIQKEILNDLEIIEKFQTKCEAIYLP